MKALRMTAQIAERREDGAPAERGGARRVAYLTTAYPKVSHTFIRREIFALEALGWEVLRLAIRDAGEVLVDPEDLRESQRTRHCLREPPSRLLGAALRVILERPRRAWRALGTTFGMARLSERGLLRHLAYFVEACWLVEVCREAAAHHVHVHFGTNAAAVARLATQLGGPRYSMTVHGPDEFDAPVGLSLGAKVHEAAFVAAISDFCSAQLRRWSIPADWERIHVVRCALPVSAGATPSAVDPNAQMLLTVGRLSAQKGHLLLLEAVARLRSEDRGVSLVLAGDGELRESLTRDIAARGLEDAVRITGWVSGDEVQKLLHACRVLVLPSFAEGLPVVLMEAFAAGRSVVTTWVAGIPELVRPGENGWLVPAGDVDALVAALREVLDAPPSFLDARARAGRERVLRNHDVATEAASLSRLFAESLSHVGVGGV